MKTSFGLIKIFNFEFSLKNRQNFEMTALHTLCIGSVNGNFRKKSLI